MPHVALFLGQAVASQSVTGYIPGNRHAVIVFLRQESSDSPNFDEAEHALSQTGWTEVAFSKAVATFPAENLNALHPHAGASYEDALRSGFAAIVFADPIVFEP